MEIRLEVNLTVSDTALKPTVKRDSVSKDIARIILESLRADKSNPAIWIDSVKVVKP